MHGFTAKKGRKYLLRKGPDSCTWVFNEAIPHRGANICHEHGEPFQNGTGSGSAFFNDVPDGGTHPEEINDHVDEQPEE